MKTNNKNEIGVGMLPPHDEALEGAVLGAIMLERSAIEQVVDLLQPNVFYYPEHEGIYKAIQDLYQQNSPIDMLTVTNQLKKLGTLDACGGPFRITSLVSQIASSAHVREHATILLELFIRREAGKVAANLWTEAYAERVDIGEVISQSGKEVDGLMEKLIGKSNGKHISEVLKASMEELYKRVAAVGNNEQTGIDTGLRELNRITNGWQPSELVILAARPAMGKTAMMLFFAKKAAMQGIPVALFSMEMPGISLADRLILSCCGVEAERFKSGKLTDVDLQEIEEAKVELEKLPIYIDDNPCVKISYIHAKCKLLQKQGRCGMIFADYIQLAEREGKEDLREQEVARMSRRAKIAAKDLNVPFILLSQLNRASETRLDKRPFLSDLRESGAIEQDADMVCFVHRPAYYGIVTKNKQNGLPESNYGELIIAKNRNGSTGVIKFKHNNSLTKFHDYDLFK